MFFVRSATGLVCSLRPDAIMQSCLDDGRPSIDNIAATRGMRSIVIGRNNYLFKRSDNGGKSAAFVYMPTKTAKSNGVDPRAWLADLVGRVVDHKINRIDELLPWQYDGLK